MSELPFTNNSAILERLYQHFDYLQDFPCQLEGSFINEATHLGTLEADDFLGFIMAYRVEAETPTPDHFFCLSEGDNLKINNYRDLRPVEPWPQPLVGIAEGKISGIHQIPVMMKPIGQAQLYWGEDIGMIWEAILNRHIQERIDFEALIHQFWSHCEEYLKAQGVKRIYTPKVDPAFETSWYRDFLNRRGYQLHHKALVKTIRLPGFHQFLPFLRRFWLATH